MSKLDEILHGIAVDTTNSTLPERMEVLQKTKGPIKKLFLDLLKESDYDQFEFVDKVSKL